MKPKPTAINKITRPTLPKILPRTRLFRLLDQAKNFPITWISGPPGSGKTTLIASYLDQRKLPCLWYRVDEGDADLATFFYYLGLAGQKANPRTKKPLPLLTPEYQFGIPTFARRYFENLYQRLKAPYILVFDNYQTLPVDVSFHEIMRNGFSETPPGIRILIVSRADPAPAFVPLLANNLLHTIDWEELRLTLPELKGLLRLHDKKGVSQDALQSLHAKTQGWTAGVVLLEKMGEEITEPSAFNNRVPEAIFDYFAGEIFDRMDPEMQTFLLKTSYFPRMTPLMAEQLTGNSKAGRILTELNRKNYFVEKKIKPELTYQYHALFREFLLSRFDQYLLPGISNETYDSAARLLEQAGFFEDAAALYIKRKAWHNLTAFILNQAADMVKQGRHRPLQEWLDSLPNEIMQSNPDLLYWKGMSLLPFAPLAAKPFFEQAFDRFQTAQDTLGAILAGSGVLHAIAFGYDDFRPFDHWYIVLNDLAAQIETFPNPESEAALIAGMVMALKFREIVHPDAETWVQRALDLPETPDIIHFKIQAVNYIYWHKLLTRGKSTLPLLQLSERLAQSYDTQPMAVIILQISKVHYFAFLGSNCELIRDVEQSLKFSRKTGLHLNDMWFYAHAAASFLDSLDHGGAQLWFEKIAPMLEIWPNWLRSLYYLQLMRAALIQRELSQALNYGERSLSFAEKVGNKYGLACTQLVLAQVFHKMDKEQDSLYCLHQGRTYAQQTGNGFCMSIALLYEAQFNFDKGDEPKGLSLLTQALALVRETGYLFTFADDPTVTLAMCTKALEAGIEVEYTQEIIRKRGLTFHKPPVHLENWPWLVKIYTLGRFGIVQEKKPAQSSRKAQQRPLLLLKALIALGGREIEEERITSLVWPDADGDMAHQSFESTLHRLRKLLGRPEVLVFKDGRLTLDNRFCWVDAWAFEHLLNQAEHLHAQAEKLRAREVMHKAVNLYRGAFLAGERVEPWMVSPSERLRNKYFKAASDLGRMLEAEDRYNEAVKHYEHMLEKDDCREETFQRLMTCHAKLGQISEALAVYQRCSKTLSSVLGIAPSPATEAIRASLFRVSH
jgi:DNA-binding SARP family transcriptional activator